MNCPRGGNTTKCSRAVDDAGGEFPAEQLVIDRPRRAVEFLAEDAFPVARLR